MAKKKPVNFKHSEISHLLRLLEDNEREGFYFGRKDFYWKQHESIKNKLQIAANTSSAGVRVV